VTITKLLTIFDVFDEESDAVDSFKIRDAVAVSTASRDDVMTAIAVR
jgi:hypothetical protein